jgi:hypothetical protein
MLEFYWTRHRTPRNLQRKLRWRLRAGSASADNAGQTGSEQDQASQLGAAEPFIEQAPRSD